LEEAYDDFYEEEFERDEAKEDEYDYFDPQHQPNSEENAEGRVDYHIMDDIKQEEEEMLDEEEIRERNANILQELYDKI
jgi:predicted ribosome quality control (RQC) complex YloA/Tae2 family protein